jgi:hypothetical protein
METCDWCGNIDNHKLMAHEPEFGKLGVCYDCLVAIYNSVFPAMRFTDSSLMTSNLLYKYYNKADKIYTGYSQA